MQIKNNYSEKQDDSPNISSNGQGVYWGDNEKLIYCPRCKKDVKTYDVEVVPFPSKTLCKTCGFEF